MKTRVFALFSYLFFISLHSIAKDCNLYVVNYNNATVNHEDFEKSLNKLDLDKFRPYFKDYVMKFNNGIEVTLIAAQQLIKNECRNDLKKDYPSIEYLLKNVNSFQYNEKQGTVMALFNIINTK